MENNSYKDMSLFKDVEDATLRARNRGVVMGNIAMDGFVSNDKPAKAKSQTDLLAYFAMIPENERRPAIQIFLDYMKSEGFALEKVNG